MKFIWIPSHIDLTGNDRAETQCYIQHSNDNKIIHVNNLKDFSCLYSRLFAARGLYNVWSKRFKGVEIEPTLFRQI